MIISVDFDGTLALGNGSHIELLKPNHVLIDRLNKLDAYIKIVTARGDKYKLDYSSKEKLYLQPIIDWLQKYNVKYNEISFNKEYAHLYIDDMSIKPYEPFNQILSPFTKNKIIFTTDTVIKLCKTSLNEAKWYSLAINFDKPEVLFYNNELIITEYIHGIQPKVDDVIKLIDRFKETSPINDAPFSTYLNNTYYRDNIIEHPATFYHGDLSIDNMLSVNGKIYLIDPNYKDIFGSYLTDAGKAAFSYFAANQIEDAKALWNKYNCYHFSIAEGIRVVKYKPEYKHIVDKLL